MAHIDPTTEEIIGDALDLPMQGRTMFVIARRLSTIRDADNIVVLDRAPQATGGMVGFETL